MLIHFTVADLTAEFHWNAVTSAAQMTVGTQTVELEDPLKLSSQFQLARSRSWTTQTQGHEITIVKRRPRFLAGFRKNYFTVSVDGSVIAEASGR